MNNSLKYKKMNVKRDRARYEQNLICILWYLKRKTDALCKIHVCIITDKILV